MSRTHKARHLLVNLLLVGILSLLSACSLVFGESPGNPDPCAWLQSAQGTGRGGTAVYFDQSGSMRAGKPTDQVFDTRALLKDVLSAAVKDHDTVQLGAFDGSSASVRLKQTLVTDRGSQNLDNATSDSVTASNCLDTAVDSVVSGSSLQPGSDILGAITAAKAALAKFPGKKNIVLVTDGISNVGCADLRTLAIGNDGEIDRVGEGCAAAEPDLRGYTLTLLGVGQAVSGQPLPGSGSLNWLNALWSALCSRMHADLCHVSTAPVKKHDANAVAAATGMPDAIVTFPPDSGLSQGEQVVHVASNVLFTPNSWTISPTGKAMLKAALDGVDLGAKIEVDGYTEAQASPEINKGTAQQRADAVKKALNELGADDVKAVGFATTAPHCPGGTDDQARQCNRRVDIKVTSR